MTEKPRKPRVAANGKAAAYFIYVLRNHAGTLYTGIALDVTARCAQHNDGRGARFTRGRGPWVVIHVEGPLPHGDALRRELRIKADRRFKAELKARQIKQDWKATSRARTTRKRSSGAPLDH